MTQLATAGPNDGVGDLRHTIDRLDAENAELRRQLTGRHARGHHRSRTVVAIALVVVAGLQVPVALTGAWLRTTARHRP